MVTSYRHEFNTPEKARRYETHEYSHSGYASILWEIEKELLLHELQQLRTLKTRVDYLDFACGSGRVISFIEPKVNSATGIDVSKSMLEIAHSKIIGAQLICADITGQPAMVEARYDLITSFRFLLNAEASLRTAALNALALRLRDRDSRLVINNHGNPCSHKLIAWPYHMLQNKLRGKSGQNYLVHRDVEKMLCQAGLEIVTIHGYGQLSAKALNFISARTTHKFEAALVDIPIIRGLGVNQMYVTKLRK